MVLLSFHGGGGFVTVFSFCFFLEKELWWVEISKGSEKNLEGKHMKFERKIVLNKETYNNKSKNKIIRRKNGSRE